jgi:hypothetical protein
MKPEIDRVRDDLETMQKALGIAPSVGRDWIQWMKRDKWIGLWWCLPGFILMAAGLLPPNHTRYLGFVPDQWAGFLVSAVILCVGLAQMRKVTADDGRPEGLIREYKRIGGLTTEGFWFGAAMLLQVVLYGVWCRHYGIGFAPCWAGIFLVLGSSWLMTAVASKVWTLLGWAIPLLGYGISLLLLPDHAETSRVLSGLMFVAIALSFSFISVLQIRLLERQHAAD